MLHRHWHRLSIRIPQLLGLLLLCASSLQSQSIRIAQEHADTRPFQLVITILEETIDRYGDGLHLEWVDTTDMNQPRALHMLERCEARYDVFFSGYDIKREQNLRQVDFPLTMGLLGVRGFVTTEAHRTSLPPPEQARQWLIGSGRGWPDTRIMKENGFQIAQANYENLWIMLEAGRFDVFQRGIQEAQLELQHRSDDLVLMSEVMMVYPLAMFLYVSPCEPDLHRRLETMLYAAHRDGLIQSLIHDDPYAALAIRMITDDTVYKIVLGNEQTSPRFQSLIEQYWLTGIRSLLQEPGSNQ